MEKFQLDIIRIQKGDIFSFTTINEADKANAAMSRVLTESYNVIRSALYTLQIMQYLLDLSNKRSLDTRKRGQLS